MYEKIITDISLKIIIKLKVLYLKNFKTYCIYVT